MRESMLAMIEFDVKKVVRDCLANGGLTINLDRKYPPISIIRILSDAIAEYFISEFNGIFKITVSEKRRKIYIYNHAVYEIYVADSYERVVGTCVGARTHIDDYIIKQKECNDEQI